MKEHEISWAEKFSSLWEVLRFKPGFSIAIFFVGISTATLEGIGLSFLLPIIELAQAQENPAAQAEGLMAFFVRAYQLIGVPLTLEYVIIGVGVVMSIRFTLGFLNVWLGEILRQAYVRHLKYQAFDNALDAKIAYFDQEGSDDILNAIVTQAGYSGQVIQTGVEFLQKVSLAIVFTTLALILAPGLTLLAAVALGGVMFLFRFGLESGYSVGDRVADANERIQENVQAGTQGIRDVKLFGLSDELREGFSSALDNFVTASVAVRRNQGAINQFYQLAAAVVMFSLIYLGIVFASLSLATLGLFLFAMFRLAPVLSTVNDRFYKIEGNLPHLVRTQEFIQDLERQRELMEGRASTPDTVDRIVFDEVYFSYNEEKVLAGLSFEVERGEFVAFVGQSGAGKSTIASLLARLYEPDKGEIRVNGTSILDLDIDEWRSKIAYVRQQHFIFNDTLRNNLTVANRSATQDDIERVCRIARVDEFLDDLPSGYDTTLGDDGVQLSGGQRQRVAIARALLKDAEILLLDEATSDLDSNLEGDIQRAIESMSEEYTTIAIAHRLSTVMNADRIYTIEAGRIIEVGDHGELVGQSGKYAEMYDLQTQ